LCVLCLIFMLRPSVSPGRPELERATAGFLAVRIGSCRANGSWTDDPAAVGNRHLSHVGAFAAALARELAPLFSARERDLAHITEALIAAGEADEPVLLGRLTRLAAEIDSRNAANHLRFSAAAAYYDLVQRRI
jgi:Protein of unknown function (DUF3422)